MSLKNSKTHFNINIKKSTKNMKHSLKYKYIIKILL
jgi:hypothetical protein